MKLMPKTIWCSNNSVLRPATQGEGLQIHLDLLHQEVSCSPLNIKQTLHLILLKVKIVLLHDLVKSCIFTFYSSSVLSLFSVLTPVLTWIVWVWVPQSCCRETKLKSVSYNIHDTGCYLEWRQGQMIAQLERRRGNKATGPGVIGLNKSSQIQLAGKESDRDYQAIWTIRSEYVSGFGRLATRQI